jgi:hypothetical protein
MGNLNNHAATHWEVSKDLMDQIADEALASSSLPQERPAADPEVMAGDDPDFGFGADFADVRKRAGQLAYSPIRQGTAAEVLSYRRRQTFIKVYSQTGNMTYAASKAGWHPSIPKSLRRADPAFREQMDYAAAVSLDILKAEAFRRGVHGWQEPVFGKDGIKGYVTRYDSKMLDRLIGSKDPDWYGGPERRPQGGGRSGGVLKVTRSATPEERTQYAKDQQAEYREKKEDPLA